MARLQSLNEELKARQSELEAALSARSRFYSSMSHEIRTPINAILGYCSLLTEDVFGPLNERQLHGVERTCRAAQHLLELVNDALDLSKVDAGKLEVEFEQVSFPDLIEDLVVTLRPLADEHGTELTLVEEIEPAEIQSDPRRVRQILLNLVSNGIKCGQGKPVKVIYGSGSDGAVELAVVDQGDGIAAEYLTDIFEEFVQLPSVAKTEGTGLGLPISRRLAELLGGSITVESSPGAGSTFRLSLPARPPGALGSDETEDSRDQALERGARVAARG
jgi:signal transduction histidine kinase